jgi:pilus assembly protein CpaC
MNSNSFCQIAVLTCLSLNLNPTAAQTQETGGVVNAPVSGGSKEVVTSAFDKTTKRVSRGSVTSSGARPALAASKLSANLTIFAGQVRVLELPGVERVAIGNGAIIGATVVSEKQVIVIGELAGATNLYIWLRSGTQINYEVIVTNDNVSRAGQERLLQELKSLLASFTGLQVSAVGDKLIVDGVYPNDDAAAKIQKIVKAYPQVLNLIRDKPAEKSITPEPMIQLDVKVIEVRKKAVDNFGIAWKNIGINGPSFATSGYFNANSSFRGVPGAIGSQGTGYPITTPARPFVSYLGLATQISSLLNFLEQTGDSFILAEPRISAVSGGSSKVTVGGEVPIPVAAGPGLLSIVYKEYGVILEFKPIIDSNGNLRSTIIAEVSSPDGATGSGGFLSFTKHRTETEVSLKKDETLVISGLIRGAGFRNRDGIPGIGRLPVIGSLFSTQEVNNEQLETLVVVTPRISKGSEDSNQVISERGAFDKLNRLKGFVEERLAR